MMHTDSTWNDTVLVAIHIAKSRNDVAVQFPDRTKKRFTVANKTADFQSFSDYLKSLGYACRIGFEATGNYHRPLAYYLGHQGFGVRF